MNTVKINGVDIPYDFRGMFEIHLNPMDYGVFHVIGKKSENGESSVLFENAAVSFINPAGEDIHGITTIITVEGNEPYVVDCRTYEKICSMKDLIELKTEYS